MEIQTDTFKQLFAMQKELNDKTFKKNDISMNMDQLINFARSDKPKGANSITNEWLRKYGWGMRSELEEMTEELFQKWWTKDILDMQNIRVELIDVFHFWMSACMCAGLEAEDVVELYFQKNKVNHHRQDDGNYTMKNKTEEDNKAITVNFTDSSIEVEEVPEQLDLFNHHEDDNAKI